jgi:hypothetical protein
MEIEVYKGYPFRFRFNQSLSWYAEATLDRAELLEFTSSHMPLRVRSFLVMDMVACSLGCLKLLVGESEEKKHHTLLLDAIH